LDSTASSADERKTLLFRVGEDVFACDIDLVRGVVRVGATTRIPGAPAFVRGLLNVRGEVLSVLDVGMRLQPDRGATKGGSIVVVQVGERRAGLVVEEVLGVHAVVPDRDGATEPRFDSEIVRHLGHLEGRIVLFLNVPAFVSQSLV
jgi:purine-binding chemotaxis protein CheW